jgi:hypothetical protein
MGANDFMYGNFRNNTKPALKKLETSSKTLESLIDTLINSKLLKVRVTFTGTGDTWNPVYCLFFDICILIIPLVYSIRVITKLPNSEQSNKGK